MTFTKGRYYGGGWPRGRRRNGGTNVAEAKRLILSGRRAGWTWRAIAAKIGMSVRQAMRYSRGEDAPTVDTIRTMRLQMPG